MARGERAERPYGYTPRGHIVGMSDRWFKAETDTEWRPDDVGLPAQLVGWLLMTFGMLGFWGLLIALVIALVRRTGPPDERPHSSPEEILAEGFARGELDA